MRPCGGDHNPAAAAAFYVWGGFGYRVIEDGAN
jgi:hypothetical protein